ncbi:hypothetical protein ABFX02_02G093700 [Erythranthe guttata]
MPYAWPRYPRCASDPCTSRECCGQNRYNTIWPNLIGVHVDEARDAILDDNPLVNVVFVPQGGEALEIFCCNRVCVFMDENYVVCNLFAKCQWLDRRRHN